jgi:hypothetical protein
MCCIGSCGLGSGLQYAPDAAGHGFIEPAWSMPFEDYQSLLRGTAGSWSEVRMVAVERFERLAAAAKSDDTFIAVRQVVQDLLNEGQTEEAILADLEKVRSFVSDEREDSVLDVMDLLVGWCAPSAKLKADPRSPR